MELCPIVQNILNFISFMIGKPYSRYLYKSFGFDGDLFILHGVFFLHRPYLRAQIRHFLELRKELKQQNTLVSMAKANFLKLLLNGVYGYTLARINSDSSPFTSENILTLRRVRHILDHDPERVKRVYQISSRHAVLSVQSYDSTSCVSSPLIGVGAAILGASKVILLDSMMFLLRYLDPRMAEMVYSDTDSVFIAVCSPRLEENVPLELREEFLHQLGKYVDSPTELSGYLHLENICRGCTIYGEKMYTLWGESDRLIKTRMKGVPNSNLKTFTSETAELLRCGKGSLISQTNTMKRTIDGPISLTRESKRFKLALHPRKRCFKSSGQHSLPWC